MIYHCLYHYGEREISLQYDLSKKKWSILSNGNEELEMLVARFNVNEGYLKFDDQNCEMIRRLNEHFGSQHRTIDRDHLKPIVAPRSRQESTSSSIRNTSSVISLFFDSDRDEGDLSSRSTRFLPASRSSRRIIQSMVLDVRRKYALTSLSLWTRIYCHSFARSTFARLFHCSPSFSKIHRLGLHFLSIYHGKFNYLVGRQVRSISLTQRFDLTV